MTALCGGGPSESRPGFNGGVYLGAEGITAILKTLVPAPVADAIAAIVSADALDLTTFCTTDPPPMPTPGPEDFVALLNPADFAEYDRVRKLFIQWWEHIYWYQACQCTTGPTPPLGPVAQPGPGGQNSGLPSGGVAPCWETTQPYSATGVSSGIITADLTAQFLPVTPQRQTFTLQLEGHSIPVSAVLLPPSVTSLYAQSTNHGGASGTGVNAMDGNIHCWSDTTDLGGLAQIFNSQAVTTGSTNPGTPIPAGAKWIGIAWFNVFDGSMAGKTASWDLDIQFRCAGSGLQSPCCPPDPKLELKIDQMFQLLVNLNQAAPASAAGGWTDGPRHNGLEKAGSFLIGKGTIGIRFEFTTIPLGFQVSPGNPNFYWDLGFWTPYALGSPMRGARLVFNPESFHLPDFTDQIGYTLASGVIANAIELIPTTP